MWPLPLSSHPVLAYAFAYAQKAVTIHQGDTLSTVNYIDSSLLEDEVSYWNSQSIDLKWFSQLD